MMNKMNDMTVSSKKTNLTAVKWYLEQKDSKKYEKTCNELKELIKKVNEEKKTQDKEIKESMEAISESFKKLHKMVEDLKINKN